VRDGSGFATPSTIAAESLPARDAPYASSFASSSPRISATTISLS